MQYREYGKLGFKVSTFGMGCMRLPSSVDDKGNKTIHREEAIKMIRYAADHGVNYFDSAHVYFDGDCDRLLGEALSGGYRERVKVVSKIPPGHVNSEEDFFRILDEQLEKLQTDHLDVLLAHNLGKESFAHLKKINMVSMMEKAKAQGKIKAIACSFHDDFDTYKEVIDYYPWDMSQIQMNILDVNNQATVEGMKYAAGKGIAIVIMEPLRGGSLCKLSPEYEEKLHSLRPGVSMTEWAFRFLQSVPGVTVTLSGMSDFRQMQENIAMFEKQAPLNEAEMKALMEIAGKMTAGNTLPCTSCRYCTSHCPKELDIPWLISLYNEHTYSGGGFIAPMALGALEDDKKPSACIGCRACEAVCPQQIKISEMMKDFAEKTSL